MVEEGGVDVFIEGCLTEVVEVAFEDVLNRLLDTELSAVRSLEGGVGSSLGGAFPPLLDICFWASFLMIASVVDSESPIVGFKLLGTRRDSNGK